MLLSNDKEYRMLKNRKSFFATALLSLSLTVNNTNASSLAGDTFVLTENIIEQIKHDIAYNDDELSRFKEEF